MAAKPTFLQSVSAHPGLQDVEAKRYAAGCLQMEALATSAALRCLDTLESMVKSPPTEMASARRGPVVRLLLSHLLETIMTLGEVASDGRVTVAFILMRAAEDTLDLIAALAAMPELTEEYTRDDDKRLKPSDAAKRFTAYLQGIAPQRAGTWADSRKEIRDALHPYAHVNYVAVQQNVHGQLKEAEQTGKPVHVNAICQPVARVYSHLFGLSYSTLEALGFAVGDQLTRSPLAAIEQDLPAYLQLVEELGISGT